MGWAPSQGALAIARDPGLWGITPLGLKLDMPVFTFEARTAAGLPQRGTQEAPSPAAVATRLRERGWLVVNVQAAAEKPLTLGQRLALLSPRAWLRPRSLDIELSLQQIGVMLRSGLTLLSAL